MIFAVILYLFIGAACSWVFIWSGMYKMKSTSKREVTTWFRCEKTVIFTFLWPFIIIKGLIQNR